jgi:hypothetical protein
MITLIQHNWREDVVATEDRVVLADGSLFVVPR